MSTENWWVCLRLTEKQQRKYPQEYHRSSSTMWNSNPRPYVHQHVHLSSTNVTTDAAESTWIMRAASNLSVCPL